MQGLRRICDEHGILLISDDSPAGAGRTGKMWSIQKLGRGAGHRRHSQGHCQRHAV